MHAMTRASSNGIEIEYETFGDRDDPTLLMVMGLGAQMIAWDVEFVEAFVDRGFHVVRYDNRDVGLSTHIESDIDPLTEIMKVFTGDTPTAPYLLSDMATDAVGLLDHLEIERAHVLGASMGGMISQSIAIAYPDRVQTLTSIMSTTGDPEVGQPDPAVIGQVLAPPPEGREAVIAQAMVVSRAIGSPELFEEDRARRRAEAAYDRAHRPVGTMQQLVAIMASGSRADALRQLDVPALVVHGDRDPLVTPSGGEHTHECLAGSTLLMLEGMGHDLPSTYWATIVDRVTALAADAPAPV